MQGNRGVVTRCGSSQIWARLESWEGAVDVTLDNNGICIVKIGSKHNPDKLIFKGKVPHEDPPEMVKITRSKNESS